MDSDMKFKWIARSIIVVVVLAVIYITKAFLTTIIWSLFVAYLLYPLYSYLLRTTKNKQISALLTLSLVFAIFLFCTIVVLSALTTEVLSLRESQYTLQGAMNHFLIFMSGFAERYIPGAAQYAEGVSRTFEDFVKQIIPRLLSLTAGALTGIAAEMMTYLAEFFISVLLVYYLLIDGENTLDKATHLVPERDLILKFIDELKPIYKSLFSVYLTTCLLTGVFAAIGFFLLGVPYPLLWGIIVAVVALLPLIGAGTVYVPMALYYLAVQEHMLGMAILIFGIIFLSAIPENIIRPRLAMKGASIHPAITLLAFAAPLFVIGAVGIIIGPALYGFLLAVYRTKIRLMKEEKESDAVEDV